MTMAKGAAGVHSGSSFDDFLEEEGYRNEVESVAIKRVLAWQFEQAMIRQQKTKRAMAAELKTSRSQLDRLLDPQNTAVSLDTLTRAAHVLGKRLVLEIRDAQRKDRELGASGSVARELPRVRPLIARRAGLDQRYSNS